MIPVSLSLLFSSHFSTQWNCLLDVFQSCVHYKHANFLFIIIKRPAHNARFDWTSLIFSRVERMNDVTKAKKNLLIYKTNKIAFVSLYCDRNICDPISTKKIPGNTRLSLVFSLGIFPIEMTSFMFLSQHRYTQAIFYFSNIKP